jgi:hypothetical protein
MMRRLDERFQWESVKEHLAGVRADDPCEWGCFVCPASPSVPHLPLGDRKNAAQNISCILFFERIPSTS